MKEGPSRASGKLTGCEVGIKRSGSGEENRNGASRVMSAAIAMAAISARIATEERPPRLRE
jgi:hypothetical protein